MTTAPPPPSLTRPTAHGWVPPASSARRLCARLVDWTLEIAVVLALFLIALVAHEPAAADVVGQISPSPLPGPFQALVIGFLLACAYEPIMMAVTGGATLGKLLVDIRVVDAATLHPVGPGAGVGRTLVLSVVTNIPLLQLVAMVSPTWRDDGRGWWDTASGTRVIRRADVRPKPPAAAP